MNLQVAGVEIVNTKLVLIKRILNLQNRDIVFFWQKMKMISVPNLAKAQSNPTKEWVCIKIASYHILCYRDALYHIQINLKTRWGSCDENHIIIYQQISLMTTI